MGFWSDVWDSVVNNDKGLGEAIIDSVGHSAQKAFTEATGNWLGKTAHSWIISTYDTSLLQNIKGTITTTTTDTAFYEQIQSIYDGSVLLVAYIILIWFFIAHFIELGATMRLNYETTFSALLRFLATKFVIDNAVTILITLDKTASMVLEKIDVVNAGKTGSIKFPTINEDSISYLLADDAGLVAPIGAIFSVALPFLISNITKLTIYLATYSRLIELFVRGALVPLALPSIIFEGTRGPGIEALKKYFAVVLQGAVLLLMSMGILLVFGTIFKNQDSYTFEEVSSGYWIEYCMIFLTTATMFNRSGAIAKDIVGTH